MDFFLEIKDLSLEALLFIVSMLLVVLGLLYLALSVWYVSSFKDCAELLIKSIERSSVPDEIRRRIKKIQVSIEDEEYEFSFFKMKRIEWELQKMLPK